tara:strand:+ start:240 stop:485 length:246 start_codon:yes stop_codon:yes gene_type:complete
MIKTFKDKVILIMVLGLFLLLSIITIGDFYISTAEGRPVDESVINLLKMALTGIIGVVAGYMASGGKATGCGNPDCKCGGA